MNEEPKPLERWLFMVLLFVLPMVNLGLCIWLVKELNEIARMLKP